eukprot:jgi/Undpi1/6602/HiC_scaffold_20.g09081.m1
MSRFGFNDDDAAGSSTAGDDDDGDSEVYGEGRHRRHNFVGETKDRHGSGGDCGTNYNNNHRRHCRVANATTTADDSKTKKVAPTLDHLDNEVTAAILTQAAFRGYRLRDRLRRLPAREAEKTIQALHANARGFRRLALYAVFFGLYFSLVFGGADVAFQRSVQQGLRDHLELVRYGPEKDRSHTDVTSLSDVYQWMQLGRLCTGRYLEICAASLNAGSTSPPNRREADNPDYSYSASSSASAATNTSDELTLNASALSALVLEPLGGVKAAAGHLVVENVPLNGIGYVANRNRIIGGMLIKFARRMRLPEEKCESSRDYIPICLADEEDKDTIVPAEPWPEFRPDTEIVYNEIAGGYLVMVDTGGFNVGLNIGLCALLVMEDLEVIPPDDVHSVSVQLITYNGNQKSAYGSISMDFQFQDECEGHQLVQCYCCYCCTTIPLQKGNDARNKTTGGWTSQRTSFLLFAGILLCMVWHDTSKWWRLRRSKAKRNRWHCLCGFTFFVLIFCNITLWLVWSLVLASTVSFETDFQGAKEDYPSIVSVAEEVVALHRVALFASTHDCIFVLTTMAGFYRWIFQILTFHKRMSIVADTLRRASTHLDHFLFVFFLVVMVFTNLTWLLVGSSAIQFSTLEEAWRSVVRVSLGEYENFYPQILDAQPIVGPVIVVLYQVLGIVLLLNVVIAVLLEGSTFVPGVDGRPVMMIRRSGGPPLPSSERHLSFNCKRHITVTEMQALIEAAPVPAFVADRL